MAQFSVTVVIPVWNQWQFTKGCLDTLRPTLGLHDNVIVVDNGSEDSTTTGLKHYPWVTVIRNDENRGFAAACNQGAADATGDIVVFLNNDTVLSNRWLDGLTAPFADTSVAATGPRTNFVSGPYYVPVTQGVDDSDGVGYTLERMSDYRQWAKDLREANKGRTTEVDHLFGFCLAVRRSDFESVGGFDEQFTIGGYEDEDLCRRFTAEGKRLVVAESSFVHHVGGVTFEANGVDCVAVKLENRTRFNAKHGLASTAAGPEPLLSACMIVKDEADNIDRCLTSLNGVVDEVVVYDTGSTDGTIELARQAGATVIEGYWDDDFSRARNEALARCNGRWVMHIDADEEFEGDPLTFRDALATSAYSALQIDILNVTDNNKHNLTHRPCRLFKRELWHWTGRIHEQVTPRGNGPRPEVAFTEAGSLVHHGYTAEAMTAKNKAERNIRIAQIDADDSNSRDSVDKMTNLGRSLSLGGRVEEAMDLFRQAREIPTDSPIVHRTLLRSGAVTATTLGLHDEALGWVDELEAASTHKDTARYFRGMAYAGMENWEKTIETLEALPRDMKDDDGVVFPMWVADVKLALAYASVGRWDDAAEAITPAAFEEANDEQIWSLVAEAYWRTGRDFDALFATIPAKQINAALAQLAAAPAEAADAALESLWKLEDRRNNVLALAVRTAPHLPVERALEWSVRLHAVGLADLCPLISIAWDTNRTPVDRIRAAAVANAVNSDDRAVRAVKMASSVLPKSEFERTLYQVHELAPALLEQVVIGASTQPNRSFAMGQALFNLGADSEGIAVLMDGFSKGADGALVEQAAEWLEAVGHADDAAEIRRTTR